MTFRSSVIYLSIIRDLLCARGWGGVRVRGDDSRGREKDGVRLECELFCLQLLLMSK